MRHLTVRSVMATAVTAVSFATCAFFLSSTPASAGLLDPVTSIVPTPILSPVTNLLSSPTPLPSVVNDLLSPLPTVSGVPPLPVVGSLNDTINQVTGTIGGVTNPVAGPTQPTGGGTSGTTTTQVTKTNPSTTTTVGGTAQTGAGTAGFTSVDGTGVLFGGSYSRPYGEITGNALRHAAGRAMHLAGPLAPPLLLGCVALVVLLMLTRGSTALVKIDTAGIAGRRWRI